MGRADVYLQPDAPDPVLSERTILDLAARHTGRATALLEVDESGGEARAYLLTGHVVVKTQRPHRLRPRTSLEREALILDVLALPPGCHTGSETGCGHENGRIDGPTRTVSQSIVIETHGLAEGVEPRGNCFPTRFSVRRLGLLGHGSTDNEQVALPRSPSGTCIGLSRPDLK